MVKQEENLLRTLQTAVLSSSFHNIKKNARSEEKISIIEFLLLAVSKVFFRVSQNSPTSRFVNAIRPHFAFLKCRRTAKRFESRHFRHYYICL